MDRIDRILLAEEELTPSSDFAVGVMEAVRREQAGLGPIPFPWLRFSLGFVVLPALLLTALWLLVAVAPARLPAAAVELLRSSAWTDVRVLWLLAVSAGSGLLALWSCELAESA